MQLWLDLVDMDEDQFKDAVAERKAEIGNSGKEAWILAIQPVTPQATLVASSGTKEQ